MLDFERIELEVRKTFRERLNMSAGQEFRAIRFKNIPEEENTIILQLVENKQNLYLPQEVNGLWTQNEVKERSTEWINKYQGYTDFGSTHKQIHKIGYLKISPKTYVEREILAQILLEKENVLCMARNVFNIPGSIENFLKDRLREGASIEQVLQEDGFKDKQEYIDGLISDLDSNPKALQEFREGFRNAIEKDQVIATQEVIDRKLEDYYNSRPDQEKIKMREMVASLDNTASYLKGIRI